MKGNTGRLVGALAALLLAGAAGGEQLVVEFSGSGNRTTAEFQVDDCATQRNLDERGRRQAEEIGEWLRSHGITAADVYSSQWCRCLDTAELLGLGPVEPLPALNSFFQRFEERPARVRALRAWLAEQPLDAPTVLVTHQVNISALTGRYTGSGELLVVRREQDGSLSVVGSVATD